MTIHITWTFLRYCQSPLVVCVAFVEYHGGLHLRIPQFVDESIDAVFGILLQRNILDEAEFCARGVLHGVADGELVRARRNHHEAVVVNGVVVGQVGNGSGQAEGVATGKGDFLLGRASLGCLGISIRVKQAVLKIEIVGAGDIGAACVGVDFNFLQAVVAAAEGRVQVGIENQLRCLVVHR